jgi:tRNA threonylcarbamoyladenosine modification (KEOPS) complex Cgi121 subunit
MSSVENVQGQARTTSRECTMDRMEGYIVDCVDHALIFAVWRAVSAMAFEREVAPV